MFKELRKTDGITTKIEINENGKVTYTVGKKKTTFNLSECENYTYYHNDGSKTVINISTLNKNELDNNLWLIILKGEDLLERNNEQTETRRHESIDDMNDKQELLEDGCTDVLSEVLKNIKYECLYNVIQHLQPQQQDLVRKIFFEGKTSTQVAQEIGITKQACNSRLNKIYKHIKKYF